MIGGHFPIKALRICDTDCYPILVYIFLEELLLTIWEFLSELGDCTLITIDPFSVNFSELDRMFIIIYLILLGSECIWNEGIS